MKAILLEPEGMMPGGSRVMSEWKGIKRVAFGQLPKMNLYNWASWDPTVPSRNEFILGHFWGSLTALILRTIQVFKSGKKYYRISVANPQIALDIMIARFKKDLNWLRDGLNNELKGPLGTMYLPRNRSLPAYWQALRPCVAGGIKNPHQFLGIYYHLTEHKLRMYGKNLPSLNEFLQP